MVVENSASKGFRQSAIGDHSLAGAADPMLAAVQGSPVASRTRFRRRAVTIAGWVLALTAALVAGGYVMFARSLSVREYSSGLRADAIVALTGGSYRIGDAIELLQASHGKRLLISGVNEKTGREELARLHPGGRDAISCCVDLDYRARNTIGNAIEARRWARANHFGSLLIVTSNYHLPRTMLEFQHAMPGLRLIGRPVVSEATPVERWWRDPAVARMVGIEYAKFLTAWARSRLEGDPETSRLSVIVGGRKPVSPRGPDAMRPHDSRIDSGTASAGARS